ncbi:MAG: nucleotidyltransferase domain-containing protein [Candidatus Latescibacterota bacterium]
MTISLEQISSAVDRLVREFHPQRIILFGSHARGTADDRSDVDLLVIAEFQDGRRKKQVEMDCALRGVGFARDIVVMKPEEYERDKDIPGTIAHPAYREGKVLYERR